VVGRERNVSREECPATSAGHSPCLREVNVPDGRRSPLPSPDTVVCQERVARHLAFCPTPAPATIRYGVLAVKGDHGFVAVLISIARAKGVSAYPGEGF
jgi:hypothetical protein